MMTATITRGALLASAFTLSLAGLARAETELTIHEDQLANLNDECTVLVEAIQSNDNMVADEAADPIVQALNANSSEECAQLSEAMLDTQGAGQQQAQDQDAQQQQQAQGDQAEATARDSETAEMTEEVEVEEEATIEGVARVDVPPPNVDVQVDPPQVTVRKQQPSVSIRQDPAQIEVVQEQPRVNVQIPELVVQVEIPAPSIFIRNSDPQVQVSSGDPQIEVQQGEPRVTVRQADPDVAIDLGVEEGEATGDGQAQVRTQDGGEDSQRVGGDVSVASNEPVIRMVEPEGEPQLNYESARAQVSYQGAEPRVTVEFTQEPTVEITRVGEPTVTFETAEQRDQRRAAAGGNAQQGQDQQGNTQTAQGGSQSQADQQGDQQVVQSDDAMMEDGQQGDQQMAQSDDAMTEDGQQGDQMAQSDGAATQDGQQGDQMAQSDGAATQDGQMGDQMVVEEDQAGQQSEGGSTELAQGAGQEFSVGELLDMEVIGADGANLGNPEAIIENGNGYAMIVSEGGFLGIGDTEVAIPMDRVTLQDGRIILGSLTEEEIEQAGGTNYDESMALSRDTRLSLN